MCIDVPPRPMPRNACLCLSPCYATVCKIKIIFSEFIATLQTIVFTCKITTSQTTVWCCNQCCNRAMFEYEYTSVKQVQVRVLAARVLFIFWNCLVSI